MATHFQKLLLVKLATEITPFTLATLPSLKGVPSVVSPPAALPKLTPSTLYDAITVPETGGEKNPWIRTRVQPSGGSTAYGPVQLTRSLVADYKNRHPELFDPEESTYIQRFLQQADKFRRFGKEPDKPGYHPRYDYGGKGELTAPEDKALYRRVSEKLIGQFMKEEKNRLPDIIRRWRGKEDTSYLEKIKAALGG